MTKYLRFYRLFPLVFTLLLLPPSQAFSQKEYQGLLWEITGQDLAEPSYLYGTMHVSSKVAFYLGEPFFDAIKQVDQVALELEPELWFNEVLGSQFMASASSAAFSANTYNSGVWNEFDDQFEIQRDLNLTILGIYKQNPQMLNQMLFRFYDASGNFEEDTWLDMYIYQAGKKLGKKTIGLETFQQSMEMMANSEKEIEASPPSGNRLTYKERREANEEIEASYRKGDLDKLDSLQKKVSHPAYLKWILYERNKTFVNGMDSLMKQGSMFTGVGAAHLAGENGMIEMLRKRGYTLKPVPMGKRDSKEKDKLTDLVIKRPLRDFTSGDGVISFKAPWEVFTVSLEPRSSGLISMDIANGITFLVDRVIHHGGYNNLSNENMMAGLDSLMYELVPGELISKKLISNNGNPGFDIVNRTRKGDVHRSQIIFMPDEVIIARLSALGDKIKKGAAAYYFDSFTLNAPGMSSWAQHGPKDGSFSFEAPGRPMSYEGNKGNRSEGNHYFQVSDEQGDTYLAYRFQLSDNGFIDESHYTLDKIAWALADDLNLSEESRELSLGQTSDVLYVDYTNGEDKQCHARFSMNGMSAYAFVAFTDDNKSAKRFVESISFDTPNYSNEEWYPYEDTLRYFSTSLPWENDDKGASVYQSNLFNDLDNDPYAYVSRKMWFNPPGKVDPILMEYERFQPYSYNDEIDDYKESVIEDLSLEGDLILIDELYQWNDSGCYSEHLLGDTLSHNTYKYRRWLRGRQRWTMKTLMDSSMQESQFVKSFVDSLQFLEDTLAIGNFRVEPGAQYLADIRSSDTLIFERANSRIRQTFAFDKPTRYELYRAILDSIPPLADKDDIDSYKTRNIRIQWFDPSPANVKRLEKEFRQFNDSANYQVEILKALINMGTPLAMNKAKELLLWEAPIGVDINSHSGLFGAIRDSLELSSMLFPELMDLTSYDEYERPVLRLLSTMLDSSVIDRKTYQDRLAFLTQEAKVEFRRMNSSSDEKDKYHFDENDDEDINPIMMDIYWNLLYPHRKESRTKAFFERCANATRDHSVERYFWFRHQQGNRTPDYVCERITQKEEPLKNFMKLKRLGRLDLFPDTIDLQNEYLRALMDKNLRKYSYGDQEVQEADSIVFLETRQDSIRGREYDTHYAKYLYKDGSDNLIWYAAVVMIRRNEMGPTLPPFDALWRKEVLDEDETGMEQFDLLRRQLIDRNRKNQYGSSD